MKLLEHIDEVLFEAARWKDGGSKETPDEIIRQHAGDADVMVHFSDVKGKLGINPSAEFNISTPAGIYAFPLTREISQSILNGRSLGHFSQRDWAYVFRGKGNIAHINQSGDVRGYTETDLERHKRELRRTYERKIPLRQGSFSEVWDEPSIFPGPKYDSAFYELWIGTRNLAVALKGGKYSKESSVLWTRILQRIGIDGVVDHGSSTVHSMESTQAVVFSSENAELLSMVENPIEYVHKKARNQADATGYELSKALSMNPDGAKALMQAMWAKHKNQDDFDESLLELEELLDVHPIVAEVLRSTETGYGSEFAAKDGAIEMAKVTVSGVDFVPSGIEWRFKWSTLDQCSIDLREDSFIEAKGLTLKDCTLLVDERRVTKAFSDKGGREMDLEDVFEVLVEHPESAWLLGVTPDEGSNFTVKVGPKSLNVQT